MKCACTKDVVMERDGKVEFTKGRIYHSVPSQRYCFINNSGKPHYFDGPSCSAASFFGAHFIELVEEKITPTNTPSASASQIAALANFCCECGSKFEFGENFCGKCGKARQLRTW